MSAQSSTGSASTPQETVDSGEASLLIPPNPAVLEQQPRGSILLNRNDATCIPPAAANASIKASTGASAVLSNVKNAFLFGETSRPRQPAPPAAMFNNRNRASSTSSNGSTASVGSYGGMAPNNASGRRRAPSPSPSVQFGPLPYVPNLERRRSITLGVAARSNLLKTQGGAAGGMGSVNIPSTPGVLPRKDGMKGYLMMTDEEWEYYKKEKAMSQQSTSPPELHHLVRESGKKLWQKARSFSSSSSKGSPSPKTRLNQLDSSDTGSLASVSSRASPPDSLAEAQDVNLAGSSSMGRPRLGGLGRANSYNEHALIEDSSEIGSIAEEDEEALAEAEDEVRLDMIPNPYLGTNGYKPRAESTSTMSDGRSSGGDSYNDDFEDEEDPPVELPAYLKKDMGAERRHYMHEHAAIEGSGGVTHNSSSGTATPTALAFDHVRHQHYPHQPMSQSPSNEQSEQLSQQNHLHHANIAKHLMTLDLNQGSRGDREGDATPKGPGSPRMRPLSTTTLPNEGFR